MKESSKTAGRDPIAAIVTRLVWMGYSNLPVDLITGAWRDALYPELERRVGVRLSASLTDVELDEFECLLDVDPRTYAAAAAAAAKSDPHDGPFEWLATHVPQHSTVVEEEFDRIISETVEWFARSTTSSDKSTLND